MTEQGLEIIEKLVSDILESHLEEMDRYHGDDAEHQGEAPEACSYCHDIQEAREYLKAQGYDVAAISPEEEESN